MSRAFGITPACFTIWNDDESFHQAAMEKYLDWLIGQGAQSLSVCGSTGENITMTIEEQSRIIEACVKYVAGAVPVYAGTGRYSTAHTIELSRSAEACGADGVMVILPYYLKPHKAAVLDHFRAIRSAIDIDIMVYNNPWFAGYELSPDEVAQLYAEGVVGSIKCAHGDPGRVQAMRYATGPEFGVFYGHDYAGMESYWDGADGWLSAWPAIVPQHCRAIQDAVIIDKDPVKARKIVDAMMPLRELFLNDDLNGVPHWQEKGKFLLQLQGLEFAGRPRRPLGDLSPEYKKKLERAAEACLV